MSEPPKANGSIQKLVHDQWKAVGAGELSLIKNEYNPSQLLLKLYRKKKNKIVIFQCKPKVKRSGNALLLKGNDTKKNQEFVLAVKFERTSSMKEFYAIFDQLHRSNKSANNNNTTEPRSTSGHKRETSQPPRDLRRQQSQFVWDCELCTYRNEAAIFTCSVCKHPRPLKVQTPKRMHGMQNSIQIDLLPSLDTPPVKKESALNVISEKAEDKEEEHDSKSDSKQDTETSSVKELITAIINGEDIASIKNQTIVDILLLCHDTFTDSETVLTTLLDAIRNRHSVDKNVRIRAVRMCESWMKQYWEQDFMYDDKMMDLMDGFIYDLEQSDFSQSDAILFKRIKKAFEDNLNSVQIDKQRTRHSQRVVAKIIGSVDMPKKYDIMKQTTKHIAEQITLIHFETFKQIAKREMTGQSWKSKQKDIKAPHVLQMIKQWDCISKWVKCLVLQQKSKRKRARCIEKFIRMAVCLKDLRNFSACCAIKFGLSSTVIHRLKAAWAAISRQEMKSFDEIQKIYNPHGNWPSLRVLHKNAHAPSILHTGLFLQDLLNTDEGNKSKTKDGTVNFNKLHRTYTLIDQICMYQTSYYKIKADTIMQHYLKTTWESQESYDDDKLYAISSIVKAKDAESKDIDASDEAKMAW